MFPRVRLASRSPLAATTSTPRCSIESILPAWDSVVPSRGQSCGTRCVHVVCPRRRPCSHLIVKLTASLRPLLDRTSRGQGHARRDNLVLRSIFAHDARRVSFATLLLAPACETLTASLFLVRYLEECYHSWSFVPARSADGVVMGYEVRVRAVARLFALKTDAHGALAEHFFRDDRASHR